MVLLTAAAYRDDRLADADRKALLAAAESGMIGIDALQEVKLSALAAQIPRRADRARISRSAVCRSLERLVRAEYLDCEDGDSARAPKKYRLRLSALSRGR